MQLTSSRADLLHQAEYFEDPFPTLEWLRTNAPLYWDAVAECWVLTRYDDVLRMHLDHETFSARAKARATRPVFGPSMGMMDGDDHVDRRKVAAPELMGNRLKAYVPELLERARGLVERVVGLGTVDLVTEAFSHLPVHNIAGMLGLPQTDHDRLLGWYKTMMSGLGSVEARSEGARARIELLEYAAPIIAERRAEPRHDLISRIVHAEVDGFAYSDADVQGFIAQLFTAGGETTESALSSMWANLLLHRDQLGAVRAEPSLWDNAFSETMRHDPPLPGRSPMREVVRCVDLYGERLWPGENISGSVLSANNDESVFANPRAFDIFRADLHKAKELRNPTKQRTAKQHGHLAFGAGEHFCIGYELARTQAILLSKLFIEATRDIRLAPGELPRFVVRGTTRAVRTLIVELDPA